MSNIETAAVAGTEQAAVEPGPESSARPKSKAKAKKGAPKTASKTAPKSGKSGTGPKAQAPALAGGDDFRRAANLLKIAADPVRAMVLSLLAQNGPMNVTALVDQIGKMVHITQPALSHHLKLMRIGGLIDFRRSEKFNIYELAGFGPRAAALVKHFMAD